MQRFAFLNALDPKRCSFFDFALMPDDEVRRFPSYARDFGFGNSARHFILIENMQGRAFGGILTEQLAPARNVAHGRQACIPYENAKARQMHDLR